MQALPSKHSGAILIVALIMVAALTLLTVTVMRGSALNTKLARNDQAHLEVRERAQSLIASALVNVSNLPMIGGVDATNCFNGNGCDSTSVSLAASLLEGDDASRTELVITRLSPLLSTPPRQLSSSAGLFQVANFEIEAAYDATDIQRGKANIAQGVLTLVNKGVQ